jgi:hypothetical protein
MDPQALPSYAYIYIYIYIYILKKVLNEIVRLLEVSCKLQHSSPAWRIADKNTQGMEDGLITVFFG